ncbi:MAG: hypothetical protein ABSG65_11545 [Bryobacteraceae bacterium]
MDFLETLRKKRRARSISFVLEEILQAARREAELAAINQSVTAYSNSSRRIPECHRSRSIRFAARSGLLICPPTRPQKEYARL